MKNLITYIFIFVLTMPLLQCAPNKRIISNKDTNSITNLVIFPNYSKIDVIESRDKRIRSDAFSKDSENEIRNQLAMYIPSNVSTKYMECDSTLEEEIINANIQLIKRVKSSFTPGKAAVPEYLLNVLDSLGENYGLFLFHGGFTRSEKNFKTEYIRRKVIGVASLGFYNTEPNSTYSVMIGILIDKQRKRVSMYKELYWQNRNPNEEVVIRPQVRDIILSYFQEAK